MTTDSSGWYYMRGSESVGPMAQSELIANLRREGGSDSWIYGPGLSEWVKAGHIAAIAEVLRGTGAPPPAPSRPRTADEIDYELFGDDMQFVVITLDPGEMVIAEAGTLMFMTQGIHMETVFGDPSKKGEGFWSRVMDAGKRVLTGESLFLTTFEARSSRREDVSFAAPYPGKIIPMYLDQLGGEIICQKDAFLAAARGIQISIAFRKKIGVGLFGGEGFIMQRLKGDGTAFVHAGGTLKQLELAAGETLRVDTGCLVALQPQVDYDIQFVKGIKNTLFGGEGLFFATLTGPGKVWLQSLPFSRLAGRLIAATTTKKGEGSILGGLGDLIDGDNR